jgi:hypothetical protein
VDFLELPHESWSAFFDRMTDRMRGQLIEIEVVGLEIGAEIDAEWSPLNGVSYAPHDDVLYVFTEIGGAVEHAIEQPRQIYFGLGTAGIEQVVVLDAEERKYFLRLRTPLELPENSEAPAAQ